MIRAYEGDEAEVQVEISEVADEGELKKLNEGAGVSAANEGLSESECV